MKLLLFYLRTYHPARIYWVFRLLLTIFLLIKRRTQFLGIRPYSPDGLLRAITLLGPSFIKLAQVLATRADFFEAPYLERLRQLHDNIAPMAPVDFREVFQRAFGESNPFEDFQETPFASASIGQVHVAHLRGTHEKVAVKIRRKGIERIVREDIRILTTFQFLFRPLFSQYTKNSLESVLIAFSRMIVREVDMLIELNNLEKFIRTYPDAGIRFPRPFAALCSRDALVMTFEEGVRFDDKTALAQLAVPFAALMEKLVLFYTEQILVKGYFHADPHPGNLLITEEGELVLLDFGMVTRIPSGTRIATIALVKAAYERNYATLVAAAKKLGIVTDNAPQVELEELSEQIFDIFDNESLSASSMQQLGFDLLQSMKHMPFKVPQETIYIMRVSTIIEGLGTTYKENFNGIKDILPVLQQNLARALGEEAGVLPVLSREIKQIPFTLVKTRQIIDDMHDGEFTVRLSREDKQQLLSEIKLYLRRMLFLVILLGSAVMVAAGTFPFGGIWSLLLLVGALIGTMFFLS